MGRFSFSIVTLFVLFSGLLASRPALANGRYPYAQQLLVDPTDDKRLWMRTTFGILTSPDGGTSWNWICEAGIGYDPAEDPMMALLGEGAVIAATSTGLFVTHDHGCDWPTDPTIGSRYVRDVAAEHDPRNALSLTLLVDAGGAYNTIVFRTTDTGATWAALGPPISTDLAPITIDPAPSDAQRLYVTAAGTKPDATPDGGVDAGPPPRGGPGLLLRSRDGGVTWERRRIPASSLYDQPYIAAVHPTNPDILYVRVRGDWTNGTQYVTSRLLYTDDAGDSWKQVFEGDADMLGFALSPDGGTVYLGLGDTKDGSRPVDPSVLGIYRATAPALDFSRSYEGHVGCLTVSDKTLYVCGPHGSTGFDLGISEDDGKTVTPILGLHGIDGPLACPATTPQAIHCESAWFSQCDPIGKCPTLADAGGTKPPKTTKTSSGGCSCSSPGKKSEPIQTGTARANMFPTSFGSLSAVCAMLLAAARRRPRR